METIKIKYFPGITYENIVKPMAAGDWIDLRAAEDVDLHPFEYKLIPLGVAMQLPEGYEALIAPRSSTFSKTGIILANSIGVIDETYCGDNDQWHFPALAIRECHIKKGERICQFRIIKHQPRINLVTVETLNNPDRGGIGSTGRM